MSLILSLKTALKLIDLGQHFGIRRELLADFLHPTNDGCVVTAVKDASDHRVGVVIEHVSNEVHGHVTGMDERAEALGSPHLLDGEAVEVSHDR